MSLALPKGWIETTPDDPGRIVTRDNSGDTIEPQRLPDVAASAWDSATSVPGDQNVRIDVLTPDGSSLRELHAQHVSTVCSQDPRCREPRVVEEVTVDGQPALSQFLSSVESSETLWTVTILAGDSVVQFRGGSTDLQDSMDGGQLKELLKTVRINR